MARSHLLVGGIGIIKITLASGPTVTHNHWVSASDSHPFSVALRGPH